MSRIKVMVVDDSAVVRQVVSGLLSDDPEIKVISAAADPLLAMVRMQSQWPDVIVLDIEMPRIDGITLTSSVGDRNRSVGGSNSIMREFRESVDDVLALAQ